MTQLSDLQGNDLLALHNELTGKAISRFADRKSGERQTLKALHEKRFTSYDAYLRVKEAAPAKEKKQAKPKSEGAVKVARTTCSTVNVVCNVQEINASYKSVAAAFEGLGLPMNKHIKFRGELKAAGKLTFMHEGFEYHFQAFPKQ